MKNETIIEVKNLVKKYGDFTAVKGISFEVYKGEIFGLLGPNGAGKTTTFEIMETLKDETDGDVIISGYSINKEAEKIKTIIGVQLQASGFPERLTLRELIDLFAALYDVKVDSVELLKKVQLGDKVILDEPSTGLDPQARLNLWGLIREIRDSGTTVVITTHFMDEAELLCDRVAVMDEGNILQIGSPDELIATLLKKGFKREKLEKLATLEDVFLDLTGKALRE
ncbi:MAG: ABC transporter related protein [candidate division WS6 bacterium GW2011_GWC1_36_11]|uniref:ABC transporter related protein n=1 Tax=candidate division WS6 bacterium GW2011_GWC1_36_11 TaxID=1619090 RepID=A0A0G0GEI8_9BACT|nr:MAG: ABC transporter related protein [candidate division WS6 bacterium GW2011_GWC1_36_11]